MSDVDELAEVMFCIDWPRDDWSRFKVGDHARNRYVEMAKAAILFCQTKYQLPSQKPMKHNTP